MDRKNIYTTVMILLFITAGKSFTATYYVDFNSGLDSQSGTSAVQSWKHCPGDVNATGVASNTALAAGDAVIFKGGVHYRGEIVCNWSGTPGARIVYDGNTSNTFGTGRAIIDGAERLTNWTACSSAADCGGNTNWGQIYKTTVPATTDVFIANMYENDQMLWPAQNPNVTDPFYLDDLTTFTSISCTQVTRTSVTDTNAFIQTNADYYAGCYLRLWGSPNLVRIVAITNYIPAQHTVQFADTGDSSLYTDKTVYYAVVNNISHIDNPGEFSIATNGTLYLWAKTGNPNTNEISKSIRRQGIFIRGKSCLDIQGFKIQKFTSGDNEYHSGCGIMDRLGGSNNRILNNEVTKNYSHEQQAAIKIGGTTTAMCTNILIEGNNVYENPHNRGMMVVINDSIVRNNTVRKSGGTAIDAYGCKRSSLLGNLLLDNRGVHANGLSLYEGCENCVVAYNRIFDGLIALTLGDASNITIAYNILHTADDGVTTITWSSADRLSDGIYYYNNVILNQNASALGCSATGTTHLEVHNNIMDGCGIPSGSNVSHNLYTKLNWSQTAKSWSPSVGDIIQTNNMSLIFTDYTNRDFHLISGSPAIDAGINVGQTVDFDGKPVPSGIAPDIGAYEYGAVSNPLPLVIVTDSLDMLFDFGSTTYLTPGNWNNVGTTRVDQVNELIVTNAVDINGVQRGINLRLAQQTSTMYYSTGVNASNIYPASAQRDNIYGYKAVSYRFEGAVPSAEYKLTFFASTTKSTTNRETLYTVGTSNAVLDAAYNTNQTAVIEWIQADTNGYLTFTVNTNTANSAAWYLSVLELERTCGLLPTGTVGVAYSGTLVAAGGTAPYTWEIVSGNLPAGLGLVPATGTVTGTPVTAGTTSFDILVTDSVGAMGTNTFSLSILADASGADSDGDGLPDSWEVLYFGNTNVNPAALAANGLNTIYETYVAGLDPADVRSVFTFSSPNVLPTALQWNAVSGRVYSVYWTTNLLSSFQPLETNIIWPQSSWTDVVNRVQGDCFYKIKVRLRE